MHSAVLRLHVVRLSVRNDQLKAHALVDDYVSVQHGQQILNRFQSVLCCIAIY